MKPGRIQAVSTEVAIELCETRDVLSVCLCVIEKESEGEREKLEGGNKDSKTLLDSIENGMGELGSSHPNITAILNFRSDLALIKVEGIRWHRVLTGAVEGVDLFCSILSS